MIKIIVFLSLTAIIFWSITTLVAAQDENQTSTEQVTTSDLGVENPGLLPGSPFYFLKEWGRQIQNFFTFDPVKKAQLQLDQANERAAEIEKLEEITPSNTGAISKAIDNYQQNMERLNTRLEQLKQTSQNPNVDKLLNNLVDLSIKHEELFNDLEAKLEQQTELKQKLQVSQEAISEVLNKIPQQVENTNKLQNRLQEKIDNLSDNPLKQLQAVNVLNKLENAKEATTTILKPEIQQKIEEIKNEILNSKESSATNSSNVMTPVQKLAPQATPKATTPNAITPAAE